MTNKERTKGRKFAFQFLIQTQSNKKSATSSPDITDILNDFEISYATKDDENTDNFVSSNAKEFGKNLIQEFLKYESEVEEIVSRHLHRNNLNRLNYVDLTLIKLGCLEITHQKDTPPQVIINDIVELAKTFGELESYAMINGVLESVWKSK